MAASKTSTILVVCDDYGELAFALYLLARQPFAQNTTLMLPPRLHAQNADVLPGRTRPYHSLAEIRQEMDSARPAILGLFSGYLLSAHRICSADELGSFLDAAQAQGWKCFTSDPFFGSLGDVEPRPIVATKAPRTWLLRPRLPVKMRSHTADTTRMDVSRATSDAVRDTLSQVLHIYPCGESPGETEPDHGKRIHFHNPAIFLQSESDPRATAPMAPRGQQQWLFVLGDEDYAVQEQKYGKAAIGVSRKFRKVLLDRLHETLAAGRVPTLVAPARVIKAITRLTPAASNMELLAHCEYSRFQALLKESEYVFFWNAASFSAILRTLTDKPWFTFDDGHQLRGMNDVYARRISDWFYRGEEPPRLDFEATLSRDALQEATKQNLIPAWRIRQGLLESPDPQSVFSTLDPGLALQMANELAEAFDVVQRLGEVVSSNALDGSVVLDEELLAHPKSTITSAVTLLLESGAGDKADFARLAAPTLAFFQPGVGPDRQSIDSVRPDGEPWKVIVEAEMGEISEGILASSDPASSAMEPDRAIEEANALVAAFDIVQRLGQIVSANGLDGSFVVDTALLAFPKSGIKSAVELLLERGAEDQAEFARQASPTLAFFQPGVGAGRRSIDTKRLDGRPWKAVVEAEMVTITETLQGHSGR